MTYQLRPYQTEAVRAALDNFKTNTPFIIQAATAAGKSLIIADICHKVDEPVLILQPNKEILQQNYDKLLSYGINDISMYSASMNSKEVSKYTFATIGSIKNYSLFKHFKYIIVDECHQVDPKSFGAKGKSLGMYAKFFKAINCTKVCGLTATPFRLENKFVLETATYTGAVKMLNRITRTPFFKTIAYKVEMPDLLEQGYLAPLQYHCYENDISELIPNSTGKDYTELSLEKWGDKKLSSLNVLAPTIDKKAKRVVVFCSSLRQSARAIQILEHLGIYAESVSAETKPRDRDDMLTRFRDGRLRWIVNVGVLTTGFDSPALDTVVLLRPTMSVALYMQMVGRAVRVDPERPEKVAHIYDVTGTVEKFGRVETMRIRKEFETSRKDCLFSEVGRLDDQVLFEFAVKRDAFGNIEHLGAIGGEDAMLKRELTINDFFSKI